jgi:hypothetical protein
VRATKLANTRFGANNVLSSVARQAGVAALLLVLGACAASEEASDSRPVLSRFESAPPGASVFVDGGFVGITPTSFHLPSKPSVHVRMELPGHFPVDTMLDRRLGMSAEAPAGTGWEDLYYWPLVRK